jgi:predicted dehydrogenase
MAIRIGLIGAGRMGARTHAPAITQRQDVAITAVYDPLPAAAQVLKDQYGAELCASAAELASRADVDAVMICSPTFVHIEGIRAVAKTGKPIFCEKPLCRSLAEADEIQRLLKDYPAPVTVGFVRRYSTAQQKFQEIVASGVLGPLRSASAEMLFGAFKRLEDDWFADFERSGGMILDMFIHHFDLLNWLFGLPQRVYAQGSLLNREQAEPADYMSGTLTFPNGVICNLNGSWHRVGRSSNYLEVFGDYGCVSHQWGVAEVKVTLKEQEPVIHQVPETLPVFQAEDNCWLDAILGKGEVKVTLEDGIAAVKVALALIESAQRHRVVEL